VERAARLLNKFGAGKMIAKVETKEDVLVYSGITHTSFVSSDPSSSIGKIDPKQNMIGQNSDWA